MKLLRLHVDNFGKIQDLTLDFNEGINVIKQPNAWGKSTLATFIKVMFYGFDTKKAPGATERERNFYMPWQGGVYGGELDFSVGSRSYRISRTFGASEKKDEFHVYDLETNLESVDFSGNVGEILFDLDSNSFKRSVFIAQNDCSSQTSDAINAKLGNLAANTNDINNYETAQDQLKSIMNSLNPNRATGSIKRRKSLLTELQEELRGYQAAAESIAVLSENKKMAEAEKELLIHNREAMAQQLKLASEDSRRTELQKQYLSLCEEHVRQLEALGEFKETFPVGLPDESSFDQAVSNASLLDEKKLHMEHLQLTETEKTQFEKLSAMFENAIPTEVEIDNMINRNNRLTDIRDEKTRLDVSLSERERTSVVVEPLPEKPKSANAASVIGVIVTAIGMLTFVGALVAYIVFKYPPFYMFAGVGFTFIGTICFIIAASTHKKAFKQYEKALAEFKSRQQNELDELTTIRDQAINKNDEISAIEEDTRLFLEKFSVYCGVAGYSGALYELKSQVKDYHRLKERNNELSAAEFACRELRNQLDGFELAWNLPLGENPTASLIRLKTEWAKCKSAQDTANQAALKKKVFEENNDMSDLETKVEADGSLEDINKEIAAIDERLELVRAGIDQYNRQIEDLKEELDRMDEKKTELEECQELQSEEQNRYDIVSKTQELLGIAREQFTARYMAPISNAFRKYYTQIINSSNGDDWVIDANIALKRREVGELRSVDHLSAGYQDLIGVCMRLALVDAMFQEEKPFLVLDDPFVNLDEEKTAKGMGLLHYVSADYQTIYFTCHQSRTPV